MAMGADRKIVQKRCFFFIGKRQDNKILKVKFCREMLLSLRRLLDTLHENEDGNHLPSQQENTCASFVLGPELQIQYRYTYVKNSEHQRF